MSVLELICVPFCCGEPVADLGLQFIVELETLFVLRSKTSQEMRNTLPRSKQHATQCKQLFCGCNAKKKKA